MSSPCVRVIGDVANWLNRDPRREVGLELLRNRTTPRNPIWIRLYDFVLNNPIGFVDPRGLSHFGLDGQCCNKGAQGEYALIDGRWFYLPPGACTTSHIFIRDQDCDGMTCYGGFYWVGEFKGRTCDDPQKKGSKCNLPPKRRWTPGNPGPDSRPPGPPARPERPPGEHRGSRTGHRPPPLYRWEPN